MMKNGKTKDRFLLRLKKGTYIPLFLIVSMLGLNTGVRAGQKSAVEIQQQSRGKLIGRVIEKEGEPIPGVTIIIRGSTRGVITDENGRFEMEDIEIGSTL